MRDANKVAVRQEGGIKAVVCAMSNRKDNADVQKHGCEALCPSNREQRCVSKGAFAHFMAVPVFWLHDKVRLCTFLTVCEASFCMVE